MVLMEYRLRLFSLQYEAHDRIMPNKKHSQSQSGEYVVYMDNFS